MPAKVVVSIYHQKQELGQQPQAKTPIVEHKARSGCLRAGGSQWSAGGFPLRRRNGFAIKVANVDHPRLLAVQNTRSMTALRTGSSTARQIDHIFPPTHLRGLVNVEISIVYLWGGSTLRVISASLPSTAAITQRIPGTHYIR